MPKLVKELGPLAISRLTDAGHHAVGGVAGLYLYVSSTGARSWVLRTTIGQKRRHIGLGGYPTVTLAQAREKARNCLDSISKGVDPIEERKAVKSALMQKQENAKTFEECAMAYIQAKQDEWKNLKHRSQWINTLRTYAFPIIGKSFVGDIELPQILSVLEPIWKTKTETASRLRGRLEVILDWATVREYRTGLNPARWKGHLDTLLQAPSKIAQVSNHKALPLEDMPEFMTQLCLREGMAAKALAFLVLTATRSGEVRGACWSEVDFEKEVWVIPAHRMKAGKEHRVPLSREAVQLIKGLYRVSQSDYLFPSAKGGMLSDMALTALMRRMEVDAVPHGFRSTFRDWIAEKTNYPRDMAEFALAHTLDNKTEAAYLRTDMLEKRRGMMQKWSYVISPQEKELC